MILTICLESNGGFGETDFSPATVWLIPGDIEVCEVDYPDIADHPGAKRIVGPIDIPIAEDVFSKLVVALRSIGLEVKEVTTADD